MTTVDLERNGVGAAQAVRRQVKQRENQKSETRDLLADARIQQDGIKTERVSDYGLLFKD